MEIYIERAYVRDVNEYYVNIATNNRVTKNVKAWIEGVVKSQRDKVEAEYREKCRQARNWGGEDPLLPSVRSVEVAMMGEKIRIEIEYHHRSSGDRLCNHDQRIWVETPEVLMPCFPDMEILYGFESEVRVMRAELLQKLLAE